MCPIKCEIMSVAVPREEGAFWRRLAASIKVKGQRARSRGDLQKFLMLQGLKAVCRRSAAELVAIRKDFSPRALGSGALLTLFVAGLIAQGGHHLQRPVKRGAKARDEAALVSEF